MRSIKYLEGEEGRYLKPIFDFLEEEEINCILRDSEAIGLRDSERLSPRLLREVESLAEIEGELFAIAEGGDANEKYINALLEQRDILSRVIAHDLNNEGWKNDYIISIEKGEVFGLKARPKR
jgi:hypothetical protein